VSQVQTGDLVQDEAVNASEGVYQVNVAACDCQGDANAASITHYTTCLAAALANNCGSDTFRSALRSLGQYA